MAIESQSSNIILFPKYEELKSEVEELRADFQSYILNMMNFALSYVQI